MDFSVEVRFGEKREHVELSYVTLLFYDTIHAEIARFCGNFSYFQYEDEDGDKITVRGDADVEGFRDALANGNVNCIFIVRSQFLPSNVTTMLPSDLKHLSVISNGNFGMVYKSLHIPSDQVIAVKSVECSDAGEERRQVLEEIDLMQQCLSCEFIVSLLGASFDGNLLLICLEFMDGGCMKNYGAIPLDVLRHTAVSIFEGLKFLWGRRIMHRDLKPENVLANSEGFVKLSDFGVSKRMDHSIARSYVGTSAYMAPERILGGEYRIESDVWSYGLTIWELFLGRFPSDQTSDPVHSFLHTARFSFDGLCETDQELRKLIQNCVCADVSLRWGPGALHSSKYLSAILLDRSIIANFIRFNATEM